MDDETLKYIRESINAHRNGHADWDVGPGDVERLLDEVERLRALVERCAADLDAGDAAALSDDIAHRLRTFYGEGREGKRDEMTGDELLCHKAADVIEYLRRRVHTLTHEREGYATLAMERAKRLQEKEIAARELIADLNQRANDLLDEVERLRSLAATSDVTRVEVIDHRDRWPSTGRVFSSGTDPEMQVELERQDEGRTLKVFLSEKESQ